MATATPAIQGRVPTYQTKCESYVLPNDAVEHVRLNQQHIGAMDLTQWRLPHVSVTEPKLIVEVGCGTGAATRELASRFPNAEVIGIDIAPVPHDPLNESLPNLKFIQGDFNNIVQQESPLMVDGAGQVDLLFSRLLIYGIREWPEYLAAVHRVLRPGGWAEIQEIHQSWLYDDPTLMKPPPVERWEWLKLVRDAGFKMGFDLDCAFHIDKHMQQAQFEGVTRTDYRMDFTTNNSEDGNDPSYKITDLLARDKGGLFWHTIPRILKGTPLDTPEDIDRLRKQMVLDTSLEPPETGKHLWWTVTTGRKAGS